MPANRAGKIVTFYSYKGGTGRSMALANVAWVLASAGKRVLTIDWDLEAPGLHRYFEPFLTDRALSQSTGVIDFVRDFAAAAVTPSQAELRDRKWYEPYGDLLAHAIPVNWEFPNNGVLHLVPAGRQDAAYASRVNSFDWHAFYERLGGGILLESVKQQLRTTYDFVLIDSRTGVSDTSGVCTIQMPDELVVCFTLNRQSTYGASSAARSAFVARHTANSDPTLKVWPLPTRVEFSEKDRLDDASNFARARFSGLMPQLSPEDEDEYWGQIPVSYEPYYAYEEVLAPFRDLPRQTGSMLSHMELLADHLNGERVHRDSVTADRRIDGLAAFTTRSATDRMEELGWLGDEYENLRQRMAPSPARTQLMSLLVARAQRLAGDRDVGLVGERLFNQNTDGDRLIGLALARSDPQRQHVELAISGIAGSRSAFEQFQALMLSDALLPTMQPTAAQQLRSAIEGQIGKTIDSTDQSRLRPAQYQLRLLADISSDSYSPEPVADSYPFAGHSESVVGVSPTSTRVRYNDPLETHGPWVATRGTHAVRLSAPYQIGRHLVTNDFFRRFVRDGGYENDAFWPGTERQRRHFVTKRGSPGPGHWNTSDSIPEGSEDHPVTSICYLEAQAFANWCNGLDPSGRWSLPTEDQWEFAARTEYGQIYPWGDAFDADRCNSSESKIGGTTPVNQYANGTSRFGCYDMAGNVWEFVAAEIPDDGCVLRGGSFSNNRIELRSYLRLFGVPPNHRALDFGFRLTRTTAPAA